MTLTPLTRVQQATAASESWLRTEAAAAYDALEVDPCQAIPAEDVRAGFEAGGAPVS